jgi:hypothetical protein
MCPATASTSQRQLPSGRPAWYAAWPLKQIDTVLRNLQAISLLSCTVCLYLCCWFDLYRVTIRQPAWCCGMRMCSLLLAIRDVFRKLVFKHISLLCMQVRHGTWQGIPAVYKVWDLGDSLEPLQDMQDELDAYHTLRPLQISVSASVSPLGQGRCKLPSRADKLVFHISLFLH